MKLLEGKTAIVTGSGRGVGRGHCLHLAKNGAKVVVNDILLEEAQKVADEIKAAGGEAIASNADIGSRAGCELLVQQCVDAFGGIDIAINNAGIVRDKTLLKLEDADFDIVWRIHVMGT
ncbi:MAG TPA: SDR family NAD(P)-dependent oxidoreductase, partial [Pseudomonadales bacterium]|nr:SDR family NAD(P)-dependent oxidoreductase [Pseudomonadales bacterium]